MKGLTFSFMGACCAATSSLCMRKNTESKSPTIAGFLTIYYLISLIASFVIFPEIWSAPLNWVMLLLGACVGIFNMSVMVLISGALQRGSSAMTFAFQNASAVFPGVILYFFFGREFGYHCSIYQYLGISLVMLGLYMGTRTKNESGENKGVNLSWLKYAIAGFFVQVVAMTLIQGRCVFFESEKLSGFLSNFAVEKNADVWFMPGLFGIGFLVQACLFLKERRLLAKREAVYGSLAGLTNWGATWLLLLATKFAMPFEKVILLPSYAVTCLILCSIWSSVLYKEKFNYLANGLCAIGVFVGSLV